MDAKVSLDVGANILNLLERLAAQIGVTADKVFPWYVKQQSIVAVGSLAIYGLVVACCIGALLAVHRKPFMNGKQFPNNFLSTAGLVKILASILLLITLFVASITGPETLAQLVNPEYAAVSALLRDLRGMAGR